MPLLIGLFLAVGCLAVLLLPFLRARRPDAAFASQQAAREQAERRQAAYNEIQALRLDYELGNVPEEEYQTQLRRLRLQAAATLRDQERLEAALEEYDRELEGEIASFRRSRDGAQPPST